MTINVMTMNEIDEVSGALALVAPTKNPKEPVSWPQPCNPILCQPVVPILPTPICDIWPIL